MLIVASHIYYSKNINANDIGGSSSISSQPFVSGLRWITGYELLKSIPFDNQIHGIPLQSNNSKQCKRQKQDYGRWWKHKIVRYDMVISSNWN